ncbi:MAG: hypothetical protein WC222_05550 [Parachlamydiales bacterium]|jgi:hypothetical protein
MNKLIYSVIGTTLILALLASFFIVYVFDFSYSLVFFAGALWGSVNLFLIKCLVENLLSNLSKNYIKVSLLLVLKFPLLYGAGYFLLKSEEQAVIAFMAGLTLLLLTTVLLGISYSLQERT